MCKTAWLSALVAAFSMLSDRKVVGSSPACASLVPEVCLFDVQLRASQSSQPNLWETVCCEVFFSADGLRTQRTTTV